MSYYREGDVTPVRTGRAARTRVGAYNSPQRRRDVLTRLTMRVNAAAGVLTVADALRERGADADLTRRYASPVGRKVAEAARKATGTDPAQNGLAVAGRRLVWASGYTSADRPMLDAVIDAYEMRDPDAPKTGKAARVRLLDVIAQRSGTQTPAAPAQDVQQPATATTAALVAELAQRHEAPTGYATERVEAILESMRGNPRLYDPQSGTLSAGGAAVVRSVLHAEDVEGMLHREAQAWQDTRVLTAA